MNNNNIAETTIENAGQHIGNLNEGSLHSEIKEWYATPSDALEVGVENYVIDIYRDGLLIEIQTRNFSAIKKKLTRLLDDNKVRLVYPVVETKWLINVAPISGEEINRRKSPKRGKIYDVFYELIRVPELITKRNFELEVLLVGIEEMRCDDGLGSWRRKGVSIIDKHLIAVNGNTVFSSVEDYLALLPTEMERPFTNKCLAAAIPCRNSLATKITYTLRRAEILSIIGKSGRSNLYDINNK